MRRTIGGLQRFFQFVRLDGDVVAILVVRILGLPGPKVLALDRTNWKLGSCDVNILVLSIVTQRFRVPLMWSLLDHGGNSSTAQRIELMRRYLRLFEVSSIDALLAHREFVGARWLEFLNENNVPFVVRLRKNLQVRTEDDGMPRLFRTLVHKNRRSSKRNWTGWLHTMAEKPENRLKFAAKRIRGKESLIIATNMEHPRSAIAPLSASLGHRMPLLGYQDPWLQHRGYPHHRFHQTLDPPRHRHPRRDVGTPLRDPGDGAQTNPPENAQTAREVLVPNRVRCSSEVDHPRPG